MLRAHPRGRVGEHQTPLGRQREHHQGRMCGLTDGVERNTGVVFGELARTSVRRALESSKSLKACRQ